MIRSTAELYNKFPWIADYPQMALYIIQFGINDLIPIPWVARNTDSAEKMYKACVEAGKDWRTLYGIKREEGEVW